MDGFLKQSTASQSRQVGPFIDDTDFKTAKTGLSIANTDIKITKAGGALASKNSGGCTEDSLGWYTLTWDATDTATVGELKYTIKKSGALVVFGSYWVLEEAVYDALFAASAPGYVTDQPVNATKIGGTSQTGADIGSLVAKFTGITALSHWLGALAGKQAANSTAQTEIRASGAGSGTYDPTTDSLEALRDNAGTAGAGLTDITIKDLHATAKAAVNAEVVDGLNVDTYAEPGQENPGATVSLAKKISYLYKAWRNKSTQDATTYKLFADDASTVDQKASVTDSAGTLTVGEKATGP